MFRLTERVAFLVVLLLVVILNGVESKRGGSIGDRGSSASRSSSVDSQSSSGSLSGSLSGSISSLSDNSNSRASSVSSQESGSSSSESGGNDERHPQKISGNSTVDEIRQVLFPGEYLAPSKEIFNLEEWAEVRKRFDKTGKDDFKEDMKKAVNGTDKFTKQRDGETTEVFLARYRKVSDAILGKGDSEEVFIKEDQRPILVRSIFFFWGKTNLPHGDNDTDCAEIAPVNTHSKQSLCNIMSLLKCEKSLEDVLLLAKVHSYQAQFYNSDEKFDVRVVVKTANGTIADKFAWFCPPSDYCCEFACCTPEKTSNDQL